MHCNTVQAHADALLSGPPAACWQQQSGGWDPLPAAFEGTGCVWVDHPGNAMQGHVLNVFVFERQWEVRCTSVWWSQTTVNTQLTCSSVTTWLYYSSWLPLKTGWENTDQSFISAELAGTVKVEQQWIQIESPTARRWVLPVDYVALSKLCSFQWVLCLLMTSLSPTCILGWSVKKRGVDAALKGSMLVWFLKLQQTELRWNCLTGPGRRELAFHMKLRDETSSRPFTCKSRQKQRERQLSFWRKTAEGKSREVWSLQLLVSVVEGSLLGHHLWITAVWTWSRNRSVWSLHVSNSLQVIHLDHSIQMISLVKWQTVFGNFLFF